MTPTNSPPPAATPPPSGLLGLYRLLERSDRALLKVVKWVLVVLVAGMTLVVALQVFARIVHWPIIWTSEATQYLLIWVTFIGTAAAFIHGEHIALDLLVQRFRPGLQRAIAVLGHLLMLGFFVFFAIYGWRLAVINLSSSGYTIPMSQFYVFIAVPLGMALAGFNVLKRIVGILAGVPRVHAEALEVQ